MNSGHHTRAQPSVAQRQRVSLLEARLRPGSGSTFFVTIFGPVPRGTAGDTGIRHLSSRSKPTHEMETGHADRKARDRLQHPRGRRQVPRPGPDAEDQGPPLQEPPHRPQRSIPHRARVLRFRPPRRLTCPLPPGQLPPPRIPADLRLLQRQEPQASRSASPAPAATGTPTPPSSPTPSSSPC